MGRRSSHPQQQRVEGSEQPGTGPGGPGRPASERLQAVARDRAARRRWRPDPARASRQREARPPGQVPVGGRSVAGQVPAGQLAERHVDDRRRAWDPASRRPGPRPSGRPVPDLGRSARAARSAAAGGPGPGRRWAPRPSPGAPGAGGGRAARRPRGRRPPPAPPAPPGRRRPRSPPVAGRWRGGPGGWPGGAAIRSPRRPDEVEGAPVEGGDDQRAVDGQGRGRRRRRAAPVVRRRTASRKPRGSWAWTASSRLDHLDRGPGPGRPRAAGPWHRRAVSVLRSRLRRPAHPVTLRRPDRGSGGRGAVRQARIRCYSVLSRRGVEQSGSSSGS